MLEKAIETKDLTKVFGTKTAVDKLNISINKGEIFGFLGPNGSGKSTTIKMLCGLLIPTSGSATIAGYDVNTDADKVKTVIGYMSQKFSLYEDLSGMENIEFYAELYNIPKKSFKERIDEVLEVVGIKDQRDQITKALSGGWKQRLALACALVHNPKVIFLDEPTASMDPVARRGLWDLLFTLASSGVTLFVTTHYMDEAERCSHVAYIYNAKLIVSGGPDDLKELKQVVSEGTKRYEVTCRPLVSSLNIIKTIDYVKEVNLFGQALHCTLEDHATAEHFKDDLLKKNIIVKEIRPISPSLEDVFVTLTNNAMAGK